MRKFTFVLLSLMLILTCFSAVAESADVSGIWYLNALFEETIEYTPSMLGFEATMTLNADGSAILAAVINASMLRDDDAPAPVNMDVPMVELLWEVNGAVWEASKTGITISDGVEQLELTLTDGKLVSSDEEMTMVFGRENTQSGRIEPGLARADVAIEDFDGTWNATLIDMFNLQVSYSSFDLPLTLVIENGAATKLEGSIDTESFENVVMSGELMDGALMLTGEADAQGNAETIVLQLHESGIMSHSWDTEGYYGTFTCITYFELATDVAE